MGSVTTLRKTRQEPRAPAGPARPVPHPLEVLQAHGFAPAKDIAAWLLATVLDPNGRLYNPDHEHLRAALEFAEAGELAFLWASGATEKQGRMVLGTAEQVNFRAGGWQKLRQEMQMVAWFGCVPTMLITLAADYCAVCSDTEFMALVEHELYHVAHATDAEGEPRYDRETGMPKLCIRGHDVEEFVGVVRRYGVPKTGQLRDLVDAAGAAEWLSEEAIHIACGNCMARAA